MSLNLKYFFYLFALSFSLTLDANQGITSKSNLIEGHKILHIAKNSTLKTEGTESILANNVNNQEKQPVIKKLVSLLERTLTAQEYWKDLQHSAFKRFCSTNPLKTIKSLFVGQEKNIDEVTNHIKELKETQVILALTLHNYAHHHYLEKDNEKLFLYKINNCLETHKPAPFYIRHWVPLVGVTAATYLASTNSTVQSVASTLKHAATHTFNAVRKYTLPSFKDCKDYCTQSADLYTNARDDYKQKLIDNVRTHLAASNAPFQYPSLESLTINELQKIRDNNMSLMDSLENKISHRIETRVHQTVMPSWWERIPGSSRIIAPPQGLPAIDKTYLDSVDAQMRYYVETGKLSGKLLIASYLGYKATQVTKNIVKSMYNYATKQQSIPELRKDLLYCERLLNHATTSNLTEYYDGMLLYFINKFETSKSKIMSSWQPRFTEDITDLKNSELTFNQKYEIVKAMIRDYNFLNDK